MDYENLVTITVDKNLRTLTVPNSGAIFGVVGDISVNRVCFSLPRYYSGFDMSEFTPRVNYANPNGDANYYEADDMKNIEDTVKFTWLMSPDVTAYTGEVRFSLKLYKSEGGKIVKTFNTRSATGRVMEGYDVETQVTPEQQQTLLDKLEAMLNEDIDDYVENRLSEARDSLKSDADAYKKTITDSEKAMITFVDNSKASITSLTNSSKTEISNAAEAAKTKVIGEIGSDENVGAIAKNTEDIAKLKDYVKVAAYPTTWSEITQAVKSGLHKELYSIGDEFSTVYTNKDDSNKQYDNPLRINHFQDGLQLENGSTINGMWLQTKYAQIYGIQFAHPQAFYVSDSGMNKGTYCVQFNYTWGTYVKTGEYYNFTLTKDVPAGGKLAGFYYAPDYAPSTWKVYVYSADGKTVLETVSVASGQAGTLLGVMTAYGDDTLNGIQQMAYGYNRWKTSALRQYLNSDKPKGEWWTAQTKWDIAPDQLASVSGYLCGIDSELLNAIKPVQVTTYCNTVSKADIAQVKDITYDKITLPSLEQMYINPQINGEGEYHEYYKELNGTNTKFQQWQTYELLKTYAIENHSSAQYVRLRSAFRGTACSPWYINSSGYVASSSASSAARFAPLMFIGG